MQRYGAISTAIWDETRSPANIRSSFRATGIYSTNPSSISDEAFDPITVTEEPTDPE
jgi:hypothetical protein